MCGNNRTVAAAQHIAYALIGGVRDVWQNAETLHFAQEFASPGTQAAPSAPSRTGVADEVVGTVGQGDIAYAGIAEFAKELRRIADSAGVFYAKEYGKKALRLVAEGLGGVCGQGSDITVCVDAGAHFAQQRTGIFGGRAALLNVGTDGTLAAVTQGGGDVDCEKSPIDSPSLQFGEIDLGSWVILAKVPQTMDLRGGVAMGIQDKHPGLFVLVVLGVARAGHCGVDYALNLDLWCGIVNEVAGTKELDL